MGNSRKTKGSLFISLVIGSHFLLFSVFSCRKAENVFIQEDTIRPKSDQLISAKEILRLPADSITSVLVVDSCFVLFYHRQDKSDYIIRLMDVRQKETRQLIGFGQGPEQLLMPFVTQSYGVIMLHDPLLKRAVCFDPRLALADSSYYPTICKSNILSQYEIPYGGRIMFLNPYSHPEGKTPRFLISNRRWNYHWLIKYRYTAINCFYGGLVYSRKKEMVAYFAENQPKIEWFTLNGRMIRTTHFVDHPSAEVMSLQHKKVVEYFYGSFLPRCFDAVDANDEQIAAAFCSSQGDPWILIMDWEGRLIDSFRSMGRVRKLSISRDSSTLYCWETDEKNDFLNRYSLSK